MSDKRAKNAHVNRRRVMGGLLALGGCLCVPGLLGPVLRAAPAWAGESSFEMGVRAQELLARGDVTQAAALLERALAADARNEWLWGLLGRARHGLGDAAGALEAFRAAVRFNPEDTYSRMMIDMITQRPVAVSAEPAAPESALERQAAQEERQAFARLTDSRGLGYRIRRVVLDAGHGGFDPGAVGQGGLKEKDVTLDLVRRTAEILAGRAPHLKVFLTRNDDYYLPLSARTATANQYRADLFVSFHVNANENRSASGCETYFCSETASSREAERLAGFENSVRKYDTNVAGEKGWLDLEDILFRFERRRYWEAGGKAARSFQDVFAQGLPMRDRGVHSANFFVLRKARMPSVLLETGFISNQTEERLLALAPQRRAIAAAVAAAVAVLAGTGV